MKLIYCFSFSCMYFATYIFTMEVEVVHVKMYGKTKKTIIIPVDSNTTIKDIKRNLCITEKISNPQLYMASNSYWFTTRFSLSPMGVLNDSANVKNLIEANNTKTLELA